MDTDKKNIIDVVPLTRLPLNKNQSFSYLCDQKLTAGTLVSIPLFHRNVEGIVTGNRPDFHRLGNIELKKIEKIMEESFLTEYQLRLASFISDYYLAPLGIVLKSFVPKRIKLRNAKRLTQNVRDKKSITLTKEQALAVSKITKNNSKFIRHSEQNSKFLLYGPASSGKTEVYIHSIMNLKKRNPDTQSLVLLPELTLTPQALERYGGYFKPEEVAVLHSKISKGQFYSNWQKIKSGKAKIIIGSRIAVLAPFKKLALIVVDEEQDISFKQWDMSPRYDARAAAERLSKLHGTPIVFGSATPRVESVYKAQKKEYQLLKLPILKLASVKLLSSNIELIDMKKERWIKNYSPISKKLQSEVAYALKNKLQIILLINRQGMSTFSICTDCKTVLRCSRCERALIYDNSGTYRCVHCAFKTSITPECSKCKGLSFTNIGLGTQKIEREIKNLFPSARVARADSQSMKARNAQEVLYENFKQGAIDILIGTQMISKGWDLPNVALIGIIDGDAMLSMPDFSTEERAYQNIIQVSGRVSRLGAKFPGQILLQTFNPEQKFFKTIADKDFSVFYEKELKERKNLNLPPFGKLIKLIFQDYDFRKASLEANCVFNILEEKADRNVQIFEPQNAFLPNIRGRFRKQIIIKIKDGPEIPEKIRKILISLSHGWIIDIDPISII
jgi:primosomal protein N' (replication factor Y) (superfamily II helicase)